MRFGLVGTGYWATEVHGRALVDAPQAELVGVWGRDTVKTIDAATALSTDPVGDFDVLLELVDALVFAVPPDVQASLALRAARAGKHMLLEKPVATSVEAAEALAETVASRGLASVVFFTSRFCPAVRSWLSEVAGSDWWSGSLWWIGAAFAPGSPFDTPWRHDKGGLWDVGPHALSLLVPALGPVSDVTVRSGRADLVHLLLEHESGATSTASLAIGAPPGAAETRFVIWGEPGRAEMPDRAVSALEAARVAVAELVEGAASGSPTHPLDVAFGAEVVRTLALAEARLGRH